MILMTYSMVRMDSVKRFMVSEGQSSGVDVSVLWRTFLSSPSMRPRILCILASLGWLGFAKLSCFILPRRDAIPRRKGTVAAKVSGLEEFIGPGFEDSG